MIPENINEEHIRKAIDELDNRRFVIRATLRDRVLRHAGRDYSLRDVISLSNKHANGKELDPSEYTDLEVERFLKKKGFLVAPKSKEYIAVELPRSGVTRSLSLEDRIYLGMYGYKPRKRLEYRFKGNRRPASETKERRRRKPI